MRPYTKAKKRQEVMIARICVFGGKGLPVLVIIMLIYTCFIAANKYIAVDGKNQYLIIGRNPKNLFATKENLFELMSEKQGEQTVFKIKNYL